MTELEYALIPVAILLGYALTEALRCWAHIVKNWDAITRPTLYLSANFLIIALLVMHFAGLWAYRPVHFESAAGGLGLAPLLAVMTPMLVFTFAAAILMPTGSNYQIDLEDHYWRISRPYHFTFMIAIMLSMLPDSLPGVLVTPSLTSVFASAALLVFLAISRNRRHHFVAHGVAWLGFFLNFLESALEIF